MALSRNLVRLIESLRRAWPGGRTVDALARELDLQTWRVSELLGRLEAIRPPLPLEHTGQALRLDPAATPLLGELIELDLPAGRFGRSVLVFQRVASTNDVAWQAARRRQSDGLIVLAESQSSGRGRLDRSWLDRPGQCLLFSALLLDEPAGEGLSNRLVMAASVAMAEAIDRAVGVEAVIRWPNDLYVQGRKLSGILVESRPAPSSASAGSSGPLLDVVLGVGLNCNQTEQDMPDELRGRATSLAIELGRPVDRTAVMRTIVGRLGRWLAEPAAIDPLHRAYLARMDQQALGVRVHAGGRVIEGTVRDVDPIAGLFVELPGGGATHFAPTSVSVEWMGQRPKGS